MKKLRKILRDKAHVAISLPAVLCFVTFISDLIASLKDGVIDREELHQLMATADGFEAVVLFLIMLAMQDKNK